MQPARVLLGLSVLTAVVPAGQAAASADLPAWCDPAVELRAEALPPVLPPTPGCDLVGRRVHFDGAILEVPPRGTAVTLVTTGTTENSTFSVA